MKKIKIEFQSDWHIGSGAGIPGSVDRQVLRDADGLPYIPGKTLTGILRDAAEFVADIRGVKNLPSELFGNQPESHGGLENECARPAKIGIGSAQFSENVRRYILAHNLSEALFHVQPGIKIDSETGRSLDDHLFSSEKVRSDCVLYAEVNFMKELSEDEEKLFNDAVKAVRYIGGKRRRGAGACRLSLIEEGSVINSQNKITFSQDNLIFNIRLTTLQPLIIAAKTLGNAVTSASEIPGYMLLSYYIKRIFAPLGEERLRKAILNDEIAVSNFLPSVNNQNMLPVPLCMAEIKGTGEPVNRMVFFRDDGQQMKDLRTGYVVSTPDGMRYYSVGSRKVLHTHNTVEDSSQRPTDETGGLFTYEALEAGQKFMGTLKISPALWDDINKHDEIISMLKSDIYNFGRSRKDEYGSSLIECVGQSSQPADKIKLLHGKYVVVYLKSDLLLRGEYYNFSLKIEDVKTTLSEKLGVKLEDIPNNEWEDRGDFKISPLGGTRGHCIRAGRRESWQTSWTLPRPSLIYFRAGSIFLFKVIDPENWNEEKAQSLIQDGIGERRAEGYGQILLNPEFICNPEGRVERAEMTNNNEITTMPSLIMDKEKIFVKTLEKEMLRRHFRQAARNEAYKIIRSPNEIAFANYPDVSCNKGKRPTASQFGGLREAVSGGWDMFANWVNVINQESSAQNPWNASWRAMLSDLASHPEHFRELRPAFANLDTDSPAEFLGIFFDILCEAIFDDEKRMRGAVNE